MVAWLGVPLTLFTIYCIFAPPFGMTDGMQVLWVTVPLAAYVVWLATRPKPGHADSEIQKFRVFELTDEDGAIDASEEKASYREPVNRPTRTVILKTIDIVPGDLALLFDRIGSGTPRVSFELHPKIAYASVNESDELALSDHFTVLLRLDERAPTLHVQPLLSTDAATTDVVAFKKDPDFSLRFQVTSKDPKGAKAFLSSVVRDALLDLPEVWIETQGIAMSLTLFGAFDADKAKQLMEVADVFFAEYGAEGGPSLLEPAGDVVEKKKKKKKAPPAAPAVRALT